MNEFMQSRSSFFSLLSRSFLVYKGFWSSLGAVSESCWSDVWGIEKRPE